MAVVAALALAAGSSAGPGTLGERYPALRADLQGRLDVLPGTGGTGEEAKLRAAFTTALVHLDTPTTSLDTDLALAASALSPLKKLKLLDEGTVRDNAYLLSEGLRYRVLDLIDSDPDFRIAYMFSAKTEAAVYRFQETAQVWAARAVFAGDPAKAVAALKKALAALRKRAGVVDKLLRPARSDRMEVSLRDGSASFRSGTAEVTAFSAVREEESGAVVVTVSLLRDGISRDVVVRIPSPGIGTSVVPAGGTSMVRTGTCTFTLADNFQSTATLTHWDPDAGEMAGGFFVLFYGDPECAILQESIVGIFTIRGVTTRP